MSSITSSWEGTSKRWMGVLGGLPEFQLVPEHSALVIIDMQYLDAHRDYGMGAIAKQLGVERSYDYFFDRVETLVIPNIQKLQEECRTHKVQVIFLRIASLVKDCRDVSKLHKNAGLLAPYNSKEAQILDEIKPLENELVITKGCSGAFNGTAFDQILANMDVQNLIVCGVGTNGCVETTIRDAGDRNYNVILVSDACSGYAPEQEALAYQILNEQYCKVRTTEETLLLIKTGTPTAA